MPFKKDKPPDSEAAPPVTSDGDVEMVEDQAEAAAEVNGEGQSSRFGEALREDAMAQYVTFYIAQDSFALPLESVLEIIRVPETVRVPLTPPSLLGLANLRGTVLPVLETRKLLALPDTEHDDATRVVVADCGKPVGLVVDRVERVLSVEKTRIEAAESVNATVRSNLLTGVVKSAEDGALLQLLDVNRTVGLEFGSLLNHLQHSREGETDAILNSDRAVETGDGDDSFQLVSFVVDSQEYALGIAEVEEIVRVPEEITKVPLAEHHVLGLMNLRDRLLPLVSLRRMFGLPEVEINDHHRIVVANPGNDHGGHQSVGIIVDEVREVLTVATQAREQLPSLLARDDEFKEITSVCRLDDGRRLVSVLSSRDLFRHPTLQAAMSATQDMEQDMESDNLTQSRGGSQEGEEIQLVVFRLADEEYGAMIENVSEIIMVPEELTRVPKTPEFIEGMVNLRGTVLPVIDMRVRFGLDKAQRNDRQRILVLYMRGSLTGFIVDSVTEVLRMPRSVIENAPRMSTDQDRVMGRVANLKEAQRMILVLAIDEMVSQEEAAILGRAA